MKDEAREKLESLLYDKNGSFTKFIKKFQKLRFQADIQDEDCLVRYLIKSLPNDLANHTKFT